MKDILLLSVFLMLVNPVKAQEKETAHRVVFQMTSAEIAEQKGLLNNIDNLIKLWKDDVTIHVVIHGPGIALVLAEKTTFKADLTRLIDAGVVFKVCENTLKQKGIDKKAILSNMQFVPSGIAEIILRQEQGWSYIKSNF